MARSSALAQRGLPTRYSEPMARKDLELVLDYILNKADPKEFEVIAKACERRARDLKAFESLGGEGPGAMARRMAGELERGVGATMENVRGTVRGFVEEIVRKNAPEITEEQLRALLDEYAPPPGAKRRSRDEGTSLPPAALLDMASSFVDYARGAMPPSRQSELLGFQSQVAGRVLGRLPARAQGPRQGLHRGQDRERDLRDRDADRAGPIARFCCSTSGLTNFRSCYTWRTNGNPCS